MRVIAIDGPAGSGKSTVGRKLASRLGLTYLDTGAMYRSVAFAAIRQGIDPDDPEPVAALARAIDISVEDDVVVVDDIDASLEIRGPEVTRAVSVVAANPGVREEMRTRQRAWAAERGGGVIEGRDIGTVVFPDALLKVYLTASSEVRAARRAKEMTDLDYDDVAADIARRDAADSSRSDSPLATAGDAVTVDTSELDIDQTVELVERSGGRTRRDASNRRIRHERTARRIGPAGHAPGEPRRRSALPLPAGHRGGPREGHLALRGDGQGAPPHGRSLRAVPGAPLLRGLPGRGDGGTATHAVHGQGLLVACPSLRTVPRDARHVPGGPRPCRPSGAAACRGLHRTRGAGGDVPRGPAL